MRFIWPFCVFLIVLAAPSSQAQLRVRSGPIGQNVANGTVNLPYRPNQADLQGNFYFIYQGGWFQQQGQFPEYSEGAILMIGGNQPQMTNNLGRIDGNEVVLENMTTQSGCTVTRRILIDHDDGYVRIVDIFKNAGNQPINLPISYRSSLNFGVQAVTSLGDRKGQLSGVIACDQRGRGALEWFGGKSAKTMVQVAGQPNNNAITANVTLTIPAGKEIALLHVHATAATPDAAQKLLASIKEAKLLQGLPREVRHLIVNFGAGTLFINDGDIELLRGDAFDAVEMRGGDQMHGTLLEPSYKLSTFYGSVDLPADRVVSLVNVGDSRPHQLLVTTDGEIFGGRLEKQTVDLQLASGQVTKLPLPQVTRLGYRKRAGEAEEWTFDKPMVVLRTGERIAIQAPTEEIAVATRYGLLKLKPATIAAIEFQNEENGVHEIYLTDGSKFAGLVNAEMFELKLAHTPDQTIKIPANTLLKLQLAAKVDEPDASTPTLRLSNEDQLIGTVSGAYKLETAFDTLSLSGEQIKSIIHSHTSPLDVVVKLWDDTTVGGQLQEQELTCQLKSGLTLKTPVALLAEYAQPQPRPADSIAERVKEIVKQLNADDFKTRNEAQKQLTAMGPKIAPLLKELRNDQPPEGKQRIDAILGGTKPPASDVQPEN